MQSLTPQEEQQEREDVELLAGMMGGDVIPEEARRVLRKHKGNVQQAAEAILGGDRGEERSVTSWNPPQAAQDTTYPNSPSSSSLPALVNEASSSTIIDLTSDEDEYSRALQLSMETNHNEIKFGPSERSPDPAWQMVHSNPSGGSRTAHEDLSLNDAIQASLNDLTSDELELFPVEETVREGGRPIALRPEIPAISYAALVIQALFFVPQVRASVANLQLSDIDLNLPRNSPQRGMWNLVELFVNMDLAQLSAIVDTEVLPSLEPPLWNGSTETLGELTADFVRNLGQLIESHLNAQMPEDDLSVRLFQFFHGKADIRGGSIKVEKANQEGSVVAVDVGDTSLPNDLISRLSANLSRYGDNGSTHDVIFEPSKLVTFQLKKVRNNTASSSLATPSKSTSDTFVYPKHLYLDQFLVKNIPLANEKRELERGMLAEINSLTAQKQIITHFNNRDTLKDLRATLQYYERVAETNDDPARAESIALTTKKLKNILATIVHNMDGIDRKIEKLHADSAVVFDCPELQQHRYDLRAVLMHTGLPGRKQIYSYVQDNHGVWWKTVDHTVTEVPEQTVLTDPTGLHLGAGPYMLVYSRHLSDEESNAPVVWPKLFTDSVKEHNRTFLSLLPPDLAAKAMATTPIPPSQSAPPPPTNLVGQKSRKLPVYNTEPIDAI